MAGVETHLPAYLLARTRRVLDAWNLLDGAARTDVDERLQGAVRAATQRVVTDLRALIATDPAEQRVTPLEVVRRGCREPTLVLADVGVPAVVRDEFEERSFPRDTYGLTPHTLADLGDDELGPQHLVWGMAKAAVLQARRSDRH